MTIGLVRLTKRQRFHQAILFIILNLTQVGLGLAIIIWAIYICLVVSPILYSEKSEVKFVFTVIGLYGTHVVLQNLIGIKICQKCYLQAHKKSTKKLLFLWSLGSCNTLFNIVILAFMAVKISKHIVRSMRHSMEKGMQNYLKDHYWKYTIDKLQVKNKCCGVTGYRDWYEVSWIDGYHVNMEDSLVKELKTSHEGIHLPVIPWSCCRVDFPMQCFHDPLQQTDAVDVWKSQPSTVLDSIYTSGCLILLRKPIETAFVGFIIITALLFLLQISAILISRTLYTSCRNAIILDDTEGMSPGWIFGRGDCGWSRGPTLIELMVGYENSRGNSSSSKNGQKSNRSSGRVSFNVSKSPRKNKFLGKFSKTKSTPKSDEEPVSSGEEDALMLK